MTLVTIDLGDVAGGHDPDDHVVIRAEAFRESQGGGITSTAEVKIPLVDGVGQAEVEPGPVVVSFRCRAVADTREKRGVVPASGTVGIEKVLENAFEYLPPVVNDALETIQGAVDAAVEDIKWKRGMLPESYANLADIPDGDWIVASASQATGLGLPSPLISRISKHTYGSAVFYLVTTGGANPRIWLRYGNTGEWWKPASAEDIPAPWWRGASRIPAGETLESIAVGEYTLWSASHATELGLPTATQGELTKRAFGNTTTYTWTAFFPDGFQEWKRRINTTGVDTGWVDVSGYGDDTGMEATPAGMKLVPLALTLGQGSTAASGGAISGGFRVPIRYEAPITRWRVCFTNRNPRYGTPRNAQSVVGTIVVGEHVDGAYTSGWEWVDRDLSVSADGSVTKTQWQTTPIGDGRDMAISYSYTTSGPEAPPLLVGGGWDLGTETPGKWDPTRTRVIRLPFDMWIEAETYATTPVIAGFGDSITCGVGATLPVFDSWPNVYARTVGALPIHYSSSGDTFENWGQDEKAYKVSRWDYLARPDAVLWAMGTNDMASSRTFAQHQANTHKMSEIIRDRWSPNLYLATIMPRNNESTEIKAMRDQWNAWASSQPEFRDTFDFATAVRDPATGGILPAYNADGLHLSSAGSAAQAGAITRPITNHTLSELRDADTALGERIDGKAEKSYVDTADQTLGQRIDAAQWARGTVGTGTTSIGDLADGSYAVLSATVFNNLGLPGTRMGTFQVMSFGSNRTAFFINNAGEMWTNATSSAGWSGWKQVPNSLPDLSIYATKSELEGTQWDKSNLAVTSDLATLAPGTYGVATQAIAEALGLPPLRGNLEVLKSSTRTMYRYTTWQGEFPPATNKQMWFADLDTKGNITEWQRIAWANEIPTGDGGNTDGGQDVADYAFRHDLQVNEARMLVGQRKVTGTGVALVFDHGTNTFNEHILPMLRARGLTATIALNSQMYATSAARYEFDNRTDWDIITSWWTQDGIEIANHGRTHRSSPDDEGNIFDAVGGLEELRAAMPTVPIHSFVTPASLPLISSIADFDTPFGRELWAAHAIMVSGTNPKAWPLVGDIRQGVGRVWMDSPAGLSSSKNAILNTGEGKGILVSQHPELIGTDGRITLTEMGEFLDWLVAQRDSGRIEVMTLRELAYSVAGD